jgi:hypothetical protein
MPMAGAGPDDRCARDDRRVVAKGGRGLGEVYSFTHYFFHLVIFVVTIRTAATAGDFFSAAS